MNTLPTEIFQELFGYLSVHDLCSVRFLNKYLNTVVEGYLRPKLMWESRAETEIRQYDCFTIPTSIGSMWEIQTKADINQLIDIIRTRSESGLTSPTIFTSFHFHLRYMTLDQCEEFVNIYREYVERYYFSTERGSSMILQDIPEHIKKEMRKTDIKGDQDKIQVLLNNSGKTVQLSETYQRKEGIILEIDTSVSVQLFQSMLTTNRAIKSVKVNGNCERGLTDIGEMLISLPSSTAIKIFHYRYNSVFDKFILDLASSKRIEIESLTISEVRYGMAHLNDFIYQFSNKLSKLCIRLMGSSATPLHITIPYLPNLTSLKIVVLRHVFIKQFVQGQFPKLKELLLDVREISEQVDVLHNLNLEYLRLNYDKTNLTTTVQSDFDKLYAFLESQSKTLKVLELKIHSSFQCPSMEALECCYINSPLLNSFDFPSLRLVRLSPFILYKEFLNKDKVLPNVTGLVLNEYRSVPPTNQNNCKILRYTIKVFPNLTKLELFMEPLLQHLGFIFTRMFTLKELSIRFLVTDVSEDELWEVLTGFDKSKENDGKGNIYGPSLEDMQALEYLRIINPSLTFLNALEYLANTNRMKKLNRLCLDELFFPEPQWLQVENIIRTLKAYHQQVLQRRFDYKHRCWYDENLKNDLFYSSSVRTLSLWRV